MCDRRWVRMIRLPTKMKGLVASISRCNSGGTQEAIVFDLIPSIGEQSISSNRGRLSALTRIPSNQVVCLGRKESGTAAAEPGRCE